MTREAKQPALIPSAPTLSQDRLYFTYFNAADGTPVTYGPFTSEEKREEAVKLYLATKSPDSDDTLFFLDLNSAGKINSYWMAIREFSSDKDEDEKTNASERCAQLSAFCEAERIAFAQAEAYYVMAYSGSIDMTGPFHTAEAADGEARNWVNGEDGHSPISDGNMDYLFLLTQRGDSKLFVEELSISTYSGGGDPDEADGEEPEE